MLKRIELLFAEIERARIWGDVTVTFQDGAPITLRKTVTERLTSNGGGNPPNDSRIERR